MTPKQQAFVDEYLIDLNATQAATRAGYEWPATSGGYYVYFLCDDRTGAIFYVGKGKGKRVFQHRRDALRPDTANQVKAARIAECGDDMSEVVFAADMAEADALRLEKALIGKLRDDGLTNIASGHIHPLESELARIDRGIAAIRPLEEWLAVAHPVHLDAATKVKGSPEAFHSFFLEAYQGLRAQAVRQLNSIKGNSNATAGR